VHRAENFEGFRDGICKPVPLLHAGVWLDLSKPQLLAYRPTEARDRAGMA
jgi:hypothetical protein